MGGGDQSRRRVRGMRSPWRASGIALLSVAVLLGACGGDDDGAAPSEDDRAAAADFAPEVVFADGTGNDVLDPGQLAAAGTQLTALFPIYDRLIRSADDGTLEPGLAERWEYLDNTTFQLTLREGVTFHDGAPFDAEAVRANYERLATADGISPFAKRSVATVESVTVVDDRTVQYHLASPALNFPYVLTEVAGMIVSPGAFDDPNLALEPVGAGPYRVVQFQPGDRVVYERVEGYWDEDATRAEQITIVNAPNADTRLNGLRSGQYDLVLGEPRLLAQARSGGLELLASEGVSVATIFLNKTRGSLGDQRVREALHRAIDREAFVELAFGEGEPNVQLFPEGYPAYDPERGPDTYPYDPDAARALLEEADAVGSELTLLVLNRPEDTQQAQLLKEQLDAAGFNLQLQVVDPTQFTIFTQGDVDMWLGRWSGRTDPIDTLRTNLGASGSLNPGGVTTPRITELLEQAVVTEAEDDLDEILREIGREGVDASLIVPIYTRTVTFFADSCLEGFTPSIFGWADVTGAAVRADC